MLAGLQRRSQVAFKGGAMNVIVLLTALVTGVSNFTGPAVAQRVRAIDLPISPGSDYSADSLRGSDGILF